MSSSGWEIYRLELVFFDPTHKHWRLFQEQPLFSHDLYGNLPSQKRELVEHRLQIQRFLTAIRGQLPRTTAIRVCQDECQDEDLTIKFPDHWVRKLREIFRLMGSEPQEVWSSIVAYYSSLLQEEGLKEIAPRLNSFLAELEHAKLEDLPSPRYLDRLSVLNLISILPILPHWDLTGSIWLARTKQSRQPTKQRRIPKGHTLADAAGLREPWYAAQLLYPQSEAESPTSTASPSLKILGYKVNVQAIYSDLAASRRSCQLLPRSDYFSYCHDPRQGKSSSGEWALYAAYAAFIDTLQLALAGEDRQLRQLFYVAYPIATSLGRQHFLHLYLRPCRLPGNHSLQNLGQAWKPYHNKLEWTDRRHKLAHALEQIELEYFRATFSKSIDEMVSANSKDNTKPIKRLICECGYLLFPVSRLTHSGTVWGYRPKEMSLGTSIVQVGECWIELQERCEQATNSAVVEGIGYEAEPIKLAQDSSVEDIWNAYLQEYYITSQLRWAERLWQAKERQNQQTEEANGKLRKVIFRAIDELSPSDRSDILKALHNKQPPSAITLHDTDMNLEEAAKLWPDPADGMQMIRLRLEGGLLLLLSEYLELNPVKLLTHELPDDALRGWTLQHCREYHSQITERLKQVPDKLMNIVSGADKADKDNAIRYRADLLRFAEAVTSKLMTMSDLSFCGDLHKLRECLRFRIESGSEDEEKNLLDLLAPNTVLKYCPGPSDFHLFQLSLPFDVFLGILKKVDLKSIVQDIAKRSDGRKLWLFRLPWRFENRGHMYDPCGKVCFRNYLAIQYQTDFPAASRNPPALFNLASKALDGIGKVFFLTRSGPNSTWHASHIPSWSPLNKEEYWPEECLTALTNIPMHIHPFIRKRCEDLRDDIVQTGTLLFDNHDHNSLLMFTFDGWYMFDSRIGDAEL